MLSSMVLPNPSKERLSKIEPRQPEHRRRLLLLNPLLKHINPQIQILHIPNQTLQTRIRLLSPNLQKTTKNQSKIKENEEIYLRNAVI